MLSINHSGLVVVQLIIPQSDSNATSVQLHLQLPTWTELGNFFVLPQILSFFDIKPNAKFRNPTITPSRLPGAVPQPLVYIQLHKVALFSFEVSSSHKIIEVIFYLKNWGRLLYWKKLTSSSISKKTFGHLLSK